LCGERWRIGSAKKRRQNIPKREKSSPEGENPEDVLNIGEISTTTKAGSRLTLFLKKDCNFGLTLDNFRFINFQSLTIIILSNVAYFALKSFRGYKCNIHV
jgi:hypothetical protein